MKRYNLRLSDKFPFKYITVIADTVEINGVGHGGVYVFKTENSGQRIMKWEACYPVQETIIESIEEYKPENENNDN